MHNRAPVRVSLVTTEAHGLLTSPEFIMLRKPTLLLAAAWLLSTAAWPSEDPGEAGSRLDQSITVRPSSDGAPTPVRLAFDLRRRRRDRRSPPAVPGRCLLQNEVVGSSSRCRRRDRARPFVAPERGLASTAGFAESPRCRLLVASGGACRSSGRGDLHAANLRLLRGSDGSAQVSSRYADPGCAARLVPLLAGGGRVRDRLRPPVFWESSASPGGASRSVRPTPSRYMSRASDGASPARHSG